ncbi:MAG: hypothetical protein IPJ76_15630 [Flavobacteriales bacterium]|nr:MAG: hypothetical protein IPJ76_15630 [Flavobacteriales bacterium]
MRNEQAGIHGLVIGYAFIIAASVQAQSNAIFQGGIGDGHTASGSAQAITTSGIFSGGMADGYARSGFAPLISSPGIWSGGVADGYAGAGHVQPANSSGIFSGGAADGYARGASILAINTAGIFNGGAGDGHARSDGTNVKVRIQGVALLEGPWDPGTTLMNDALRAAGLVPLDEPYTALGYPAMGPGESTSATTLSITGGGAIVDWVRIELRQALAPEVLVAVRHALVDRTGLILDASTTSPEIQLDAPPGNYHVVVRHRNHLGVMSASPVQLSATATLIDFSKPPTATFGTGAQKLIGAVTVMWAGDVNGDHQLKYTGSGNDRDPVLVAVGGTVPTNTLTGQYRAEDVNLDGVVKYTGTGNDRDPILVNIGGTLPTNVRTEQVP